MSCQYCIILLLCIKIVLSYKSYSLHDLCTSSTLKKIVQQVLHEEPVKYLDPDGVDSAAVVRLSWNSSSFKRYPDCKFKFQVAGPYGLYASIRKMNLRQSPSGECYDYIKFKNSLSRSEKFCGDYEMPGAQFGNLPFASEDPGMVTVTLSLDTYRPLDRIEDTLDIVIIFLGYERCIEPQPYQLMCTPGHCVSKALKNSGLINCPHSLCLDEEMCVSKSEYEPTLNGSNIALSAITSLIFTMFAVGLCLWLCWKYSTCRANVTNRYTHNLPQQQQQQQVSSQLIFSTPATTNNVEFIDPNMSHDIELNQNRQRSSLSGGVGYGIRDGGIILPTQPSVDDKDLPPSYESLFPKKPPEGNVEQAQTIP